MTPSVVCGVDDSREARVALRVGAQLAAKLRARLVAAHVIQPSTSAPSVGPTARQLAAIPVDDLLAGGEAMLERILEEEGLVEAERRVVAGFPADGLADLGDEEDAELIVVGSRGRGAFKAALLGSVSTALVGVARRPVLVCPPRLERVRSQMGSQAHLRASPSRAGSGATRTKERVR
jgi:nucleotide-binding universal stress UspA family protein